MKLILLAGYGNSQLDDPEESTRCNLVQLGIIRSIKTLKEKILEQFKSDYDGEFDYFLENYDPEDLDYEDYNYDFENIYDKPKSYTKCFKQWIKDKNEFDLDELINDKVIEKINNVEKNTLTEIIDFIDYTDDYFTQEFKYYIIKLS